jgi:hypothetical protein
MSDKEYSMKMNGMIVTALVSLGLLLAGCSSQAEVKVYRIEPPDTAGRVTPFVASAAVTKLNPVQDVTRDSGARLATRKVKDSGTRPNRWDRLQHDSRLGREVVATLALLDTFQEGIRSIENDIIERPRQALPMSDRLAAMRAAVGRMATETETHIEDLEALFAEDDIVSKKALIVRRVMVAQLFLSSSIDGLRPYADELVKSMKTMTPDQREKLERALSADQDKPVAIATLKATLDFLRNSLSERIKVAFESLQANIGFGGFTTATVYEINPSDPQYRYLLQDKDDVLESKTPLTSAHADALGSNSVMIVMESPGQVRVYHVANDPTQVVQNVGLIMEKATLAALAATVNAK